MSKKSKIILSILLCCLFIYVGYIGGWSYEHVKFVNSKNLADKVFGLIESKYPKLWNEIKETQEYNDYKELKFKRPNKTNWKNKTKQKNKMTITYQNNVCELIQTPKGMCGVCPDGDIIIPDFLIMYMAENRFENGESPYVRAVMSIDKDGCCNIMEIAVSKRIDYQDIENYAKLQVKTGKKDSEWLINQMNDLISELELNEVFISWQAKKYTENKEYMKLINS